MRLTLYTQHVADLDQFYFVMHSFMSLINILQLHICFEERVLTSKRDLCAVQVQVELNDHDSCINHSRMFIIHEIYHLLLDYINIAQEENTEASQAG